MALHRRPAGPYELQPSDTAALPSDCREVVANFWDYLDGNCASGLAERIEAHVSSCEHCGRFRDTQKRFFAALAELRGDSPAPAHLHDRVRQALAAERRGKKQR